MLRINIFVLTSYLFDGKQFDCHYTVAILLNNNPQLIRAPQNNLQRAQNPGRTKSMLSSKIIMSYLLALFQSEAENLPRCRVFQHGQQCLDSLDYTVKQKPLVQHSFIRCLLPLNYGLRPPQSSFGKKINKNGSHRTGSNIPHYCRLQQHIPAKSSHPGGILIWKWA